MKLQEFNEMMKESLGDRVINIPSAEAEVKRVKAEILQISLWSFKTNKGWVKKEHCLYAHPPYVGQEISVRKNQFFKI